MYYFMSTATKEIISACACACLHVWVVYTVGPRSFEILFEYCMVSTCTIQFYEHKKIHLDLIFILDNTSRLSDKHCATVFLIIASVNSVNIISVVFIILALTYWYPVSSGPTRAVNCESYTYFNVVEYESYCREYDQEGSLHKLINQLKDRDWTGAELREGFEKVCSLDAPSALVKYVNCTGQLALECPNMKTDILTAIHRKVGAFCYKRHVASWLLEALSLVNTLGAGCLDEVEDLPDFHCGARATEQLPSLVNATLHSILANSEGAFRQFYSCSKTSSMNLASVTDSQCTSTWQEVSFGLALSTLGSITIGFGLPEDVKTAILRDLQDLQDLQ